MLPVSGESALHRGSRLTGARTANASRMRWRATQDEEVMPGTLPDTTSCERGVRSEAARDGSKHREAGDQRDKPKDKYYEVDRGTDITEDEAGQPHALGGGLFLLTHVTEHDRGDRHEQDPAGPREDDADDTGDQSD